MGIDNMTGVPGVRPMGTTYALAESINDVTGVYNERSITYNGS